MTSLYGADLAEAAIFHEPLEGKQRCAMRAVMKVWPTLDKTEWRSRDHAASLIYDDCYGEYRAQLKQEYGFVISTFILATIAGAILSWLVERILSRLWPDKATCIDYGFAAQMDEWSRN